MPYYPNWLSGKNGFVLIKIGSGQNIGVSGIYCDTDDGSLVGGNQLPGSSSPGGAYTSTWAFGKWRVSIRTETPKVTNFTGVTDFTTPAGIGLSNFDPNGPNVGTFTLAFQQIVAGVTHATINLEGPYDQGNMPICSGVQYGFVLGADGSGDLNPDFGVSTIAIVNSIDPFVDVEGAEMIRVSAESNGFFAPYVT